jgi:hypothetical protein
MYNNEVTYNEAHDTHENLDARLKLENKFFDRSECAPSCPNAWAPEVLALLDYLDKEFGIARNTTTIAGYYPRGNWYSTLFGVESIKSAFQTFHFYFLKRHDKESKDILRKRSLGYKLRAVLDSFLGTYSYGVLLFKLQVLNPLLNKILKPKIRLGQVKEKFGSLRVYYTAPDYLQEHIDEEIRSTEITLAVKGVYLPIETFYYAYSERANGNEYYPNLIEIKNGVFTSGEKYSSVREYSYRKAMRDNGLNLDEIKAKADAIKNTKKKKAKSKKV